MKRLFPSVIVLLATFVIGVGLTKYLRHSLHGGYHDPHQTNRPWSVNPCREGLAFTDSSAAPTLQLIVLETSCEEKSAGVHFKVTNVGTETIKYFSVRAIYTYENYVDDGAEVSTGPLAIGQSIDSFFGMGAPTTANRKSVGQLLSIKLIPSELKHYDGRKWRQPSIHEPKFKKKRARE